MLFVFVCNVLILGIHNFMFKFSVNGGGDTAFTGSKGYDIMCDNFMSTFFF